MTEKQKILHIVEAMGGGVFTYLVELTNSLSEEYDVTIAFGVRSETPENYVDYFNKNINLVRVKNFRRSVNPIKDLKATFELRRIIKELKPEIIHLHSSKAGALGRMFLSNKEQKMFYTPHGYSFLMEDVSTIKKRVYKLIEKICGGRNCLTVACGKGEWEESLNVSKKSVYISNGINMKQIDEELAAGSDVQNEEFTVYTVGRIDYQKNPEMFNAIAELMSDTKFVWIGEGEYRKKLKSSNIHITGWLERGKALSMAKSNDVFILPSRWEGLPISLLEAMYMKNPCIVSNVVGNRDVVHNGVTGYICNTAEEFAEKIRKIREMPDEHIIEKAYAEIVGHYNSGWLCSRYKEIYNEE